MADSLVTDLSQMHDMATRLIPNLASEFAAASIAVNDSRGTANLAMSQTFSPWEDLCRQLQQALADTSTNLYDVGTVLAKAADDFARQDKVYAEYVQKNADRIRDGAAGDPPPKDPVHPIPPSDPGSRETSHPVWTE